MQNCDDSCSCSGVKTLKSATSHDGDKLDGSYKPFGKKEDNIVVKNCSCSDIAGGIDLLSISLTILMRSHTYNIHRIPNTQVGCPPMPIDSEGRCPG
jgi:hypothetical protein